MRILIFTSLFLAIIEIKAFSQQNDYCGIYLTGIDYQKGNLRFKSDPGGIVIKDCLLKPNYLKVKSKSTSYYFSKDSIWGYKEKNKICRFFNNQDYMLIDDSAFTVYTQINPYRHFRKVFYYSENPSSPVMSFTLHNLAKTFSYNKMFCRSIQALIENHKELSIYDDPKKFLAVIDMYKSTLQNNQKENISKVEKM